MTNKKMVRSDVKNDEDAKKYAFQRAMEAIKNVEKESQKLENDELEDEEREAIREENELLDISYDYRLKLMLSTGGDADGFILYYNKDKDLEGGVYYWADWGEYEEVGLKDDEAEAVERLYLDGDGSIFLE